MLVRTRCYPVGGLTPILCLTRNALSSQPEIGAVASAQLLEHLRPRVRDHITPLVAGLPRPTLTLAAHIEHALVTVGASLSSCAATTDLAFYAWVSVTTTSAVLAQHAAYRSLLARRRSRRSHGDTGSSITASQGRAA